MALPPELQAFWQEFLPEPESVRRSFGEASFDYGLQMFSGGLVQKLTLGNARIEGFVRAPRGPAVHAVWETSPNGCLRLECTCRRRAYCPHQVAIYLAAQAVVRNPAKAEPVRQDRQLHAVRREAAKPWFSLKLRDAGIDLKAELRSIASSAVWPVDGRRTATRVEGDWVVCQTSLMRAVYSLIERLGFRPTRRPGHFRLTDPWEIDRLLVVLPQWLEDGEQVELDEGLQAALAEEAEVRFRSQVSGKAASGWFEFSWEVEAGGEVLTREDLVTLRDFYGRYFQTRRGRLIQINPEPLRSRIRELSEIGYDLLEDGEQQLPLHFLARAVRAVSDEGRACELQTSPELASLLRRIQGFEGITPVELPRRLARSLRHYQKDGLNFLSFLADYGFGGILADEMGLGKTLQALALLEIRRRMTGRRPSLVICPTSVAPNWVEEAARFTPRLKTIHLRSTAELQRCDFQKYDLAVISYALARRNSFKEKDFRFLILDEAQNIKNPKAATTRAVKTIPATHRLALTGTPLENSVAELWSIFDFLMPGFLGSHREFQYRYEKRIMTTGDPQLLATLASHVRPFILRRVKSQVVSELPEKTEQNIYCELTARQKVLYREMATGTWKEIQERIDTAGWEKSRIHILSALTRLRQLCCHPALWDRKLADMPSGKLAAFLEVLETVLSGGEKVIVFSQFVKMLKILAGELGRRKVPHLYLDGATRNRQQLIRRFQEDESERVFLMSLKAGGTGINLTAANYVFLFDPWWNPAVENQAIDRTHRIGQRHPVTAYRMITQGTIEEKMLELKKRKQALADSLLTTDAQVFKALTREDLQFLFS